MLLDEADVFVERRSTSDIHRNALVCIFLRKLEYYDGIMFLTTNRVQTIDEAFASRIHMPLKYEELNELARKKVWMGHLTKAVTKHGGAKCSGDDLDRLAKKKLNGREVCFFPSKKNLKLNAVDHQRHFHSTGNGCV